MSGVNGHKVKEITRPALSFMLMESYGTTWCNGYDGNYTHHPAWDPNQYQQGAWHGNANLDFCDGHVESWNHDYFPNIPGIQPMPDYQKSLGCPPYFYGCNGGFVRPYREYWAL